MDLTDEQVAEAVAAFSPDELLALLLEQAARSFPAMERGGPKMQKVAAKAADMIRRSAKMQAALEALELTIRALPGDGALYRQLCAALGIEPRKMGRGE